MSSVRVSILAAALVVAVTTTALAQPLTPDDGVSAPVFFSPHAQALLEHQDTPPHPDLLAAPDEAVIPLLAPRTVRPCETIFGYLPYWESSANIHWNLLTHLACFSVEVNSDGSLGNLHSWPWTSLINTAHANGVKVILVATCFNDSSISTLINNATYKSNFFANIRAKMIQGSADGLNIDFEGSGSWIDQINTFMADLTTYLHAQLPGCEVTFAGPSINWSGWDLPGLATSCDGIFIMGYAFNGSWSTTSGANAPLSGGTYNITNVVTTQYYPVTQVHPEKLILGLPYYGHHWTTTTGDARAPVVSFIGSTRFTNDQPNSQTYGRLWDTYTQTPWYRYQVSGVWHQVWYDDAQSLGLKYQLAQNNHLQGVGMWALNYDGARPELWNELQTRFVTNCCADQTVATEVELLNDNFDAGTSAASWRLFASSTDYTADFAFDYSTRGIPPAPHSTGTTRGLKFTVNKNDAVGATSAVNVYPTGRTFSGDYALRCDVWINYNGGAGGGTGSTEFLLAGANASGTRVNWSGNTASDGYTFAVDGEGGASDDYRAYAGATEYTTSSGVYVAKSQDHTDALYKLLFPSPAFETVGVPGKQWVELEIRQQDGVLQWSLDGVKLAAIASPSPTSGNIMLGYMDPYSSLASPLTDSFVIFDNVRVVQLAEPDCNANGLPDACEAIAAGDYNADGHVNIADFSVLSASAAGPGYAPIPTSLTCAPVCRAAFDFDADGDVDLADFAAFQRAYRP